jgi:hypothetical protein
LTSVQVSASAASAWPAGTMSIPYAPYSRRTSCAWPGSLVALPPAPIPKTSRPAAMTSTVAAILASTAGGRIRLLVTITPRRSRLVCAGSAARSVHASRAAPVTSPRSGTR